MEYPMPRHVQTKVFIRASEEIGLDYTDINDGYHQIGVSPFAINTNRGRRADSGTAFILPVLERSNLKVMTKSLVTKILIKPDTKEAYGVLFSYNNTQYKVIVNKEVILAAGAINTPQLLMLSGIGPKNHLKEHSK